MFKRVGQTHMPTDKHGITKTSGRRPRQGDSSKNSKSTLLGHTGAAEISNRRPVPHRRERFLTTFYVRIGEGSADMA